MPPLSTSMVCAGGLQFSEERKGSLKETLGKSETLQDIMDNIQEYAAGKPGIAAVAPSFEIRNKAR